MNIVGEIKYHLGNDYAQLKFSESKGAFSIDTVLVPVSYRNNGIGTILVRHVLLLADSMHKEIRLAVRPIGTFNEEKLQRLVAYYKRLDFEVLDRGQTIVYMVRTAKKPEGPS